MANKHPYISGTGGLIQVIEHLRKSFPSSLTADTLQKLGFVPNNESLILNILRFLGILSEDGKKTSLANEIFSAHEDEEFQEKFAKAVQVAYKDLFDLHGNDAWTLDKQRLISYFRRTDQTSDITGGRQAKTFQALCSLSGYESNISKRKLSNTKKGNQTKGNKKPSNNNDEKTIQESSEINIKSSNYPDSNKNIGLTVRIEINLPSNGDKETYDRIFRSIRENLINDK